MPQAMHTPRLVPTVQVVPAAMEPSVQSVKRIEKIESHSSSHRTAGTVEIRDQHHNQATVARAYQLWEEHGRHYGQSERDWYQAVREVEQIPHLAVDDRGGTTPHVDGISPYPAQK